MRPGPRARERGEEKRRRHRPFGEHALVGLREREGDEALAQRLLQDHVEQRKQPPVQADVAQLPQACARVPREQELQHLVEKPRRRHPLHERREAADRLPGIGVQRQAELGREPHRPEHPHRVFAVARLGLSDHAQHALLEIGEPAVEVDHLLGGRIEVQRVDGEVAAPRVLFQRPEHVVAQNPAVLVLLRGAGVGAAERRHLHRIGAEHHVHQAKAPADDEGAPEERADLLRARVGGDVEVLRRDAEEQVAHRASHDIGREAGLAQGRAHLGCRQADRGAGEAVAFARQPLHVLRRQPEHAPDELLDH